MKIPSSQTRTGATRRDTAVGFSLIEVMIAMVVFAIGVLSPGIFVPLGTHKPASSGHQNPPSALPAQRRVVQLTALNGDHYPPRATPAAAAHSLHPRPAGPRLPAVWSPCGSSVCPFASTAGCARLAVAALCPFPPGCGRSPVSWPSAGASPGTFRRG